MKLLRQLGVELLHLEVQREMLVDYFVESHLEFFRHFACCSRVEVIFQECVRLVDFTKWVKQFPSLNVSAGFW